MGEEMESLDDHGSPKVQGLVDEEIRICSIYLFRRKTRLHCAECKEKLYGNWSMWYFKFYILFSELFGQHLRNWIFKNDSIFFFRVYFWEIERLRQMMDQENISF